MADIKHRWIVNHLLTYLKPKFLEDRYRIEIEKYYNHYGLKGYVDIIVKSHTKDYVIIYEIKPYLEDLGEMIRQLNTPEEVLCQDFNTITKCVVCFYTEENIKFIKENKPSLDISAINIYIPIYDKIKKEIVFLPILDDEFLYKLKNNPCLDLISDMLEVENG